MSRLTRLTKDQVTAELREKFEQIGAVRGNRPEILKTMMAHMDAVTNTGTVPVRTKELVATLVSRINSCEY
jgi:alkylhydroperoxidase family enzyme